MCIAILTTGNSTVPKENLKYGWNSNPDGAGIAWIKEGKVVITKGLMTWDDFEQAHDDAREQADLNSSMLIHFRVGTSGIKRSANNTHPFAVDAATGPKGAMIHNGILFTPAGGWTGPQDDRFSDTRVLVAATKNMMTLEAVQNNKRELAEAIGYHNKLVFLYDNNEHVIINETAGYWHDGMWFSNGTCRLGNRYGRS